MDTAMFTFQGALFVFGKQETPPSYYILQYVREGAQVNLAEKELFEEYHSAEQAFTAHVSNALASRNED